MKHSMGRIALTAASASLFLHSGAYLQAQVISANVTGTVTHASVAVRQAL